jgi:hypothetical protein
MSMMAMLLQNDSAAPLFAMFGGTMLLVWLAVAVVVIIGGWKMFEKAGQSGWAILIPIYNLYIMLKIVGRPTWWILLFLIPLVNFVIAIILALDLAKAFGQSGAFGFFLLFLFSPIGYLILGFGSASYHGPAATA